MPNQCEQALSYAPAGVFGRDRFPESIAVHGMTTGGIRPRKQSNN